MRVVVSQPMFVPWIGLFEQVKLADVFVHYDDVQLPQGRSFITRVQIKTAGGTTWMSSQVDRQNSGALINETQLVSDRAWRERHLALLAENYRTAPHRDLMMNLAREIYDCNSHNLASFNQHATEHIAGWLGLTTTFEVASDLGIPGNSSTRLADICGHFRASEYLTGHGALQYLDHELFETRGMAVSYIDYALEPYPQLHGEFTPYVSVLDAIANTGEQAKDLLVSDAVDWREFARTRA
jgi:hypothetical protein